MFLDGFQVSPVFTVVFTDRLKKKKKKAGKVEEQGVVGLNGNSQLYKVST